MKTIPKHIPSTLNECNSTSNAAMDIRTIAIRVDLIGAILLFILLFGGFCASLYFGLATPEVTSSTSSLYSSVESSSDFSAKAFFVSASIFGISGLVEYILYKSLSSLLNGVAQIVDNTTISANVALYKQQIDDESHKKPQQETLT